MRPFLTSLFALMLTASAVAAPSGSVVVADLVVEVGLAVDTGGRLVAFHVNLDRDTLSVTEVVDGVPSAPAEVLSISSAHTIRDIETVAADGRMGALVVAWSSDEKSDAPAERAFLVTREAPGAAWQIQELPGHQSSGNTLSLAAAAPGAWYVIDQGLLGVSLLIVNGSTITEVPVGSDMALADVAADAAHQPHVCTGKAGSLIEWTSGPERLIHRGLPGDFYTCRIQVEADGAAWAVAAALPLVGGNCLADLCVPMPGAGKLIVAQRPADGEWTSAVTDVPLWSDLSVSTAADGTRLLTHRESHDTVVYRHSALGLTELARLDGFDASLPRQNLAPPIALVADFDGAQLHILEA